MVRLWECDVATFAPSIKADLEEESWLTARYTALLASAAYFETLAIDSAAR